MSPSLPLLKSYAVKVTVFPVPPTILTNFIPEPKSELLATTGNELFVVESVGP